MEITLKLANEQNRGQLFGPADANLRIIREVCGVHVSARGGKVRLSGSGEAVARATALLESMQQYLNTNSHISSTDMKRLMSEIVANDDRNDPKIPGGCVDVFGRNIVARTDGQREYIEAIDKQDMVFCVGPAGTGKTYLAVAQAVSMLKHNVMRRLILVRPAVEAGEKLGFLPGDMQAKVNPYLRPLFDALGDMMDYKQVKQFMYNDVIEVVPLAFMRGRTLNGAVVILDEAQNTTVSQMLMFLTRLGNDSKMIITGDASQSDLQATQQSGLDDALKRLKGIKGIGFVHLTQADIVRHRLVQNIVKAYETYES